MMPPQETGTSVTVTSHSDETFITSLSDEEFQNDLRNTEEPVSGGIKYVLGNHEPLGISTDEYWLETTFATGIQSTGYSTPLKLHDNNTNNKIDGSCLPSCIGWDNQSSASDLSRSPTVHNISTPEVSNIDNMSECTQAEAVTWQGNIPLHANPITPDLFNVTNVTNFSINTLINIDIDFTESEVNESDRIHFGSKTSTTDDVTALPQNISTYLSLLHLVSSRTARLRSLRNFASSRSSSYVEDPS